MRMYEFYGRLYRFKRNSIESGDKRKSSGQKVVGAFVYVHLDYVGFLPKVIRKTGVLITGLETMHSVGQGYVSWLKVTCPHTKSGMECFFSDLCYDSEKSKQMVAKKAIYYIMYQYNLDIVDANYGAATLKVNEALASQPKVDSHLAVGVDAPRFKLNMMSRSLPSTSKCRRAVEAPSQSQILRGEINRAGRISRQLRTQHSATTNAAAESDIDLQLSGRRRNNSRNRMQRQVQHQLLNNNDESDPSTGLPMVPDSVGMRRGRMMITTNVSKYIVSNVEAGIGDLSSD
uniref:Uncharacterized protein n=1 Tax=Chenopodium quinoa TaxID=63459 RepID=A0A803MAQ5_CHEQI